MEKQILIFGIIGGLGLFIYGIRLMGEGLQRAAGERLRSILKSLTSTPLKGMLVGLGVTSLIQSSSATTVMLVGFVNAGLMTLKQALGVILGADIGTTITAQIVAFKLTEYALPAIGLGFFINMFVKRRFWKNLGLFIFGFGILFLGLNIMMSVAKPFANSEAAKNIFINFSRSPLLGVLAGMFVTSIAQSSSATIGMVIALASVGLLDLSSAIPIILGDNIGTCITAMLASMDTNISARRTAIGHALFKVIGTLIVLSILPFYIKIVSLTSTDIARQCANAHTIFNIAITALFLPFTAFFANFIKRIVPGKEEEVVELGPKYLEKHLINTPLVALDASTKEIIRMANLAKSMVSNAMDGFLNSNVRALASVGRKERAVDSLQEAITNYLMELTQVQLSPEQANKIPSLLHSINDIERVGDHSENLVELAERKIEQSLPFSNEAIAELKDMYNKVLKMCDKIIKALESNRTEDAQVALDMEDEINKLTGILRQNHIQRLGEGKCFVLSGIVFLDMVSNFEKIGDHLANVAEAVAGRLQWQI
ncbi:MAG: Na/Pi cotransporter family protein [Candidatus Omnitrophota bacterium]|nr:MAG: Na/Pi cotransporter family protein [Candidatus Omnitrophota bacterium]